jgi:hypothetical protein
MSDPDDRQSAKTQRRWLELLRALEHHNHRAEDDSRRLRAQREELLRQWFCRHLQQTDPAPGQRPDTLLGDLIGDKSLLKRSKMASLSLPVTNLEPLSDGGWLLEARGKVAATLQKAFRKLKKHALGQMSNRELPVAGAVLDATVDDAGNATISARVVDATIVTKLRSNVYPLVSVTHTGNEILGVDLIDTDALSKGPGNRQVLVQLYQGEGMQSKKASVLARQLGVPVSTVVRKAPDAGTLVRAELIPDAGDPERRALHQQAAMELIKAARLRGPIRDPRLTMTAGLR